jgi:hypothetical protein
LHVVAPAVERTAQVNCFAVVLPALPVMPTKVVPRSKLRYPFAKITVGGHTALDISVATFMDSSI